MCSFKQEDKILRQTLTRGVFAAAAATSVLSLYGSPALADSNADGIAKGSPGLLSGNSVQAPVEVPVNVCGNTVDGAAALNPAFGNKCANVSEKKTEQPSQPPSYGDECTGYGSEDDHGYGDDCSTPTPSPTHVETPPTRHTTPPTHQAEQPPQMAETGSGTLLATSAASAVLLAAGTVLYRRGRHGAHR
ncbi:chaplin [Streptomyces anandii]|uniref:chaplin n=1 Tax=Streptomyces anandii TaxID=285454 RepID=UPI0036FABCA5